LPVCHCPARAIAAAFILPARKIIAAWATADFSLTPETGNRQTLGALRRLFFMTMIMIDHWKQQMTGVRCPGQKIVTPILNLRRKFGSRLTVRFSSGVKLQPRILKGESYAFLIFVDTKVNSEIIQN